MPNSLESMVVCDYSSVVSARSGILKPASTTLERNFQQALQEKMQNKEELRKCAKNLEHAFCEAVLRTSGWVTSSISIVVTQLDAAVDLEVKEILDKNAIEFFKLTPCGNCEDDDGNIAANDISPTYDPSYQSSLCGCVVSDDIHRSLIKSASPADGLVSMWSLEFTVSEVVSLRVRVIGSNILSPYSLYKAFFRQAHKKALKYRAMAADQKQRNINEKMRAGGEKVQR
ncbi:hypothetical protein V490_04373 [Pseudogymnoascus sp. VKM F-3557]|nr:hypothetical protein V490_04373 [Pseudogymnoascus sp. VKM F-3557]